MRSGRALFGSLVGLLALSCALLGMAQPTNQTRPTGASAAPQAGQIHSVYLRADGHLAGRVSAIDPTGTARPVRVRVSLLQAGQLVASVQSDEWGRFQLFAVATADQPAGESSQAGRLRPGVYSIVANGEEGFAAFSVRVLPFQKDAPRGQTTLEISLVPASEKKILTALFGEELGRWCVSDGMSPPRSRNGLFTNY